TSIVFGPTKVNNNTIVSTDDGIYVLFDYIDEFYNTSSVAVGSFEFNDNTITTDSDGIFFEGWEYTFYLMAPGTDATMGSISFNRNTINATQYGIYIDLYFYETALSYFGGINMLDNVLFTGMGIHIIDIYFDTVVPGTDIIVGDVIITGNHIEASQSGYYGITVEYLGAYIMDGGSLTFGDVIISDNNTIIAAGGIYFYGYLGSLTNTTVVTGSLDISNNNITATEMEGIRLDWWDIIDIYGTTTINLPSPTITGNTVDAGEYGIYLYQVNGGLVTDNIIYNSDEAGIYLETCENITVEGNNVGYNYQGIYLWMSNDNTIQGNTVSNNHFCIYLEFSNDNTILNNTSSNNYYGIQLYESHNTTIQGNTVFNGTYGIYVGSSNHNLLLNNIIFNNSLEGVFVYSSNNNTIMGGQIYDNNYDDFLGGMGGIYSEASTFLVIQGVYMHDNRFSAIYIYQSGDVSILDNNIDENCGGESGIYIQGSLNVLIEGNNVTNGTGVGITMYSSTVEIRNNRILNNTFSGISTGYSEFIIVGNNISHNREHGIWFYETANSTIQDNIISWNTNDGIHFYDSNNITIKNNTLGSNGNHGIYLATSANNTIDNNTVTSNNGVGIYLESSSNNTIYNNNVSSNNWHGIILVGSSNNTIYNNIASSNTANYGIWLYESSINNHVYNNTASDNGVGIILSLSSNNNYVYSNTVTSNNNIGIYLSGSSNNTICNNTASNNDYGIYLEPSSNNHIYHNSFIDNTNQAYDDGSNTWNLAFSLGGNYWSDWTSPDDDNDGFVDNPYMIEGGAGAQDSYPWAAQDGWLSPPNIVALRSTPGFQLVSIPCDPALLEASGWTAYNLAQDIESKTNVLVYYISDYDGRWITFIYRDSNGNLIPNLWGFNNFTISSHRGYMLALGPDGLGTDYVWNIPEEFGNPGAPSTISLRRGWNAVSLIYDQDGNYVDALDVVDGKYIIRTAAWINDQWENELTKDFNPLAQNCDDVEGIPLQTFTPTRNAHAFFVRCATACTWDQGA
ncbi:MAG: NosD domain-containing protein, partial [Candidatus Thermoplasmatota archaeon]|nr:NosD domain-containing protein [Candidatus Thermoplasmatota archaeon]